MTDASRDTGLLETVWRIRVPGGRILECGIYRCERGCFETRIGYREQRLASQCSYDLTALREAAEIFRVDVLDRAGYVELPLRLPSIEPFPGGRLVRHGTRTTVYGPGKVGQLPGDAAGAAEHPPDVDGGTPDGDASGQAEEPRKTVP